MPSTDRRRFVQTAGGSLLAFLAGCTSAAPGGQSATETPTQTPTRTPTATGTYGDLPTGPESYPDRPTDFTPETVRAYVHDVEHARTHNTLYEPDMTDISLQCQTASDRAAHGGYYAFASCSGYANYPEAHADWGQAPAWYFVSPELTVRVSDYDSQYFHCTDVFASEDPGENFAEVCEGGDAAYRVYNMHTESHTVSVTVEFLGADGANETKETKETTEVKETNEANEAGRTVLEREYTLAPTAGVEQGSVTYRSGTYRLTASLDELEATYWWELQSEPTYEDPPLVVLVTPAGGLTIRRVPFQRV